jgi:hypothetical protein
MNAAGSCRSAESNLGPGAAPHLLGLCSRYIVFALVAVFPRSLNNFSFIARTPLVGTAITASRKTIRRAGTSQEMPNYLADEGQNLRRD